MALYLDPLGMCEKPNPYEEALDVYMPFPNHLRTDYLEFRMLPGWLAALLSLDII